MADHHNFSPVVPGLFKAHEARYQEAQKRIAELERENARLNKEWRIQNSCIADQHDQLAAAQATIARKDEVLKSIRDTALHNFPSDRTAILHFKAVANEALALPSDRTALDAMLAEAEKRGMLKAAEICKEARGNISAAEVIGGEVRQAAVNVTVNIAKRIRQAAERGGK